LGLWRGDSAVGLYSTAYAVMLIPTFLSGALSSAFFPQLARVHGDEQQSVSVSSDFLRVLVWMGMPFAAIGWAFGRHGVVLLYGRDFAQSGPLLEWLSLNIGLIFFNVGIGNPFDAWGLQGPHFRISSAGALINVALNCVLIPRFGVWAAVATTLIAEVVVGIGCLTVRNRYIRLPWWSIAAKPFAFSLGAALIGRYLAVAFPDQWVSSLILVASGIIAALWISERSTALGLLHSFRKLPQITGAA
jgi:O-antigen/teichoic acid export membrane protein